MSPVAHPEDETLETNLTCNLFGGVMLSSMFLQGQRCSFIVTVSAHSFLKSQNRKVEMIPGDGFCFIQSLIKCLGKDHKIPYTYQSVSELIINTLCTNIMKYVNYHEADIPKESVATLHDALIEDALAFFKNHTYTQNIVDVLVHAAADALNICLYIYQKYDENIQIVCIDGDDCVRNVHLKFHRNPDNPSENHYDTIIVNHFNTVKKSKKNPKTTILEPIIILDSCPENSPQHSAESSLHPTSVMKIRQQQEPIVNQYNPDMSTVEPLLKKPKLVDDYIKSGGKFKECHNIQQIPKRDIENLFTTAFNSYTVIKPEEFQFIKQNDENDDSDS